MLQPVCFLGLAILTTNAIETGKCDIWCLEVGLQIFFNLWNSIKVSQSFILFLAPLALARHKTLGNERQMAICCGMQFALARNTPLTSKSSATRYLSRSSRKRTTQFESVSQPTITQGKRRLSWQHVTPNVHKITSDSNSEDFCDRLSDDRTSDGQAVLHANFEKGETGPLVPQQRTADRRPNSTDRVADAHSGRKASPPAIIIQPESTKQQVNNSKNAYAAFLLAFDPENGPKPDVVSKPNAHAKSSKLRHRPATPAPAKHPNALSVQSAMTPGSKSSNPVARRPRSRCTRVVNIENVNDSAEMSQFEAMTRVAGDRPSIPIDQRSHIQSQPLEIVNDQRQSSKGTVQSPNRHGNPKIEDKCLRLPLFDSTKPTENLDDRLKTVNLLKNYQTSRWNERQINWKQNTQTDVQRLPVFVQNTNRKPVNSSKNTNPKCLNDTWKLNSHNHGLFSYE